MNLTSTPTLLSLARIPLGLAFVATGKRPAVAMGLVAASGLTDVLDGWSARRLGLVSATGAVLDPLTDKWFVACVIGALVARGKLPPLGVLALMTRELAEIPLVAREMRHRDEAFEQPMANRAGKIATALQFASLAAAILGGKKSRDVLLGATAVAGLIAGVSYWRRALA
jgi:cardiolipin synthase (CMP-forming)